MFTGKARFSLVVATVGRTGEVGAFLESLHTRTFTGEIEVIVVDQNPDDRLTPVLSLHEDAFPIVRLRPGHLGASWARNAGLRHATAGLVAFPDDDCRYPPDLLQGVARAFEKHPEAAGLAGRLVDHAGNNSILAFESDPGPVTKRNVWTRSIESTLFFRRAALEGLWFDETLGRGAGTLWGSGEGTDYLLRLLERGADIRYDPCLTVIHHQPVPPYGPKADWRAYDYGRGMGRVLKTHRYAPHQKARYLAEPLGRAARASARLHPREASYHLNALRGRFEGML